MSMQKYVDSLLAEQPDGFPAQVTVKPGMQYSGLFRKGPVAGTYMIGTGAKAQQVTPSFDGGVIQAGTTIAVSIVFAPDDIAAVITHQPTSAELGPGNIVMNDGRIVTQ